MAYVGEWAVVAGVGFAAVMSPGPDFLITARMALRGGRAAGIAAAVGIALALTAHVAVGVLGLSLLLVGSPAVFTAVKIAGAGYLLLIGVQAMRAKPMKAEDARGLSEGGAVGVAQAFRMGVLTNLLNPKATLFFIALFTQVIAPGTPRAVKALFGGTVMAEALIWFTIVAVVLSTPRLRMAYWRVGHWFDRVAGALFAGLGLSLLFTRASDV